MSKEVILTGIRANNDLHIGNYLGALLPMVDMATKHAGNYQINLFVPDLHSFTTPIDHSKLQQGIFQALKMFVAAGLPLDHPDIYVYRQSYVPAHSELTWILDCFTGFGEMSRMTQYKDKSGKLSEDRISVGLFNYPVLMACDILLYGATYVPVGDDQTQHLEFTRDIAERMNQRFGQLLVVPKPVKDQHAFFNKDQGLRIRDLVDPTKKMSKSDETGKGVIFLTDAPDTARKKIISATTDSLGEVQHDYKERPGVSNLLDVLKLFGGNPNDFIGHNQYGPLKTAVADKVAAFLEDFQSKLANVDEQAIMQKLESSEAEMREVANRTLLKVQRAVGLRAKDKKNASHHDIAKPSVVDFGDFSKLDIKICTVLSAEHAEGSDKLLKLKVHDGADERQIMTATRDFFPDLSVLVGKQIPILTNLAARSFKGHESQGMLLAADVNGRPVLVSPTEQVPDGSPIL
jgi:tryptophanyl-tRNA synthetase